MAKLIVHNPPTVKLKASGYTGTPTGDIELTENNRTYNVSPFATATTAIPEPVLIAKQIAENGTYSAEDDNADGYSEVTVDVPAAIPIDEGSQTPLYFGVHTSGFVLSSNPADETPVAFGVDANNHPYVKGDTT